jgi:hypothetical protein
MDTETTVTICAKCHHFQRRGLQWYQQFCGASPLPRGIDYVTGDEGFVRTNHLGKTYLSTEPFAYARDINTQGTCPLYTPNTMAIHERHTTSEDRPNEPAHP